MEAMLQDQADVFQHLFDVFFAPLTNYAFGFLNDRDSAKEVVQDCFINFWNRRKVLKITVSIKSYLYTSVRNKSLDTLKNKYHQLSEGLGSLDYPNHSEEDSLETADLASILANSLEGLGERTRMFFALSREEELSYREISERMAVSVKTVEFHISSALKQIREDLEKHWYLPALYLFLEVKVLILSILT